MTRGHRRQARMRGEAALPEGRFILKLQVTVFGDPLALIYNEERTLFYEQPLSEAVRNLMGECKKAYFWATLDPTTRLVSINEQAPEQMW